MSGPPDPPPVERIAQRRQALAQVRLSARQLLDEGAAATKVASFLSSASDDFVRTLVREAADVLRKHELVDF